MTPNSRTSVTKYILCQIWGEGRWGRRFGWRGWKASVEDNFRKAGRGDVRQSCAAGGEDACLFFREMLGTKKREFLGMRVIRNRCNTSPIPTICQRFDSIGSKHGLRAGYARALDALPARLLCHLVFCPNDSKNIKSKQSQSLFIVEDCCVCCCLSCMHQSI